LATSHVGIGERRGRLVRKQSHTCLVTKSARYSAVCGFHDVSWCSDGGLLSLTGTLTGAASYQSDYSVHPPPFHTLTACPFRTPSSKLHTAALSVPALQFRTGKHTLPTRPYVSGLSRHGGASLPLVGRLSSLYQRYLLRGGTNGAVDMQTTADARVCDSKRRKESERYR